MNGPAIATTHLVRRTKASMAASSSACAMSGAFRQGIHSLQETSPGASCRLPPVELIQLAARCAPATCTHCYPPLPRRRPPLASGDCADNALASAMMIGTSSGTSHSFFTAASFAPFLPHIAHLRPSGAAGWASSNEAMDPWCPAR